MSLQGCLIVLDLADAHPRRHILPPFVQIIAKQYIVGTSGDLAPLQLGKMVSVLKKNYCRTIQILSLNNKSNNLALFFYAWKSIKNRPNQP